MVGNFVACLFSLAQPIPEAEQALSGAGSRPFLYGLPQTRRNIFSMAYHVWGVHEGLVFVLPKLKTRWHFS